MSEGAALDPWAAIRWSGAALCLLDQRLLPEREQVLTLHSAEEVAEAIEAMVVRGAPAIGCTAGFGIALAARGCAAADPGAGAGALERPLEAAFRRLGATRPTAVNLFWALSEMRSAWEALRREPAATAAGCAAGLLAAAQRLLHDDLATCREIGRAGLPLVPREARILTHCNAGALATAGYGTALGVVRAAWEAGREPRVLAGETRPFLQGARLTAWELARDGIPVTVIADSMAGHLMARGEIDLVLVGADRIARNGDVANKIGTYSLAVLARAHDLPFYVAAPRSTVDLATASGEAIPLEERGRGEMARVGATQIVPDGVAVRHPAFDVTPQRLVSAIVTETGIVRPPYAAALAEGYNREGGRPKTVGRVEHGER